MNSMKLLKNVGTRVWLIVSALLIALLVVADILASQYSGVISTFAGGDRPYEVEAAEAIVYYATETESKDDAVNEARALTRTVAEEGTILLKNEEGTLPLAKGAKISVFGKNSVNLVYGGSGSGGGDPTAVKNTIFESLEAAGYTYNPVLKSFYEDTGKSGEARPEKPKANLDGGAALASMPTYETPQSKYPSDVISSYAEYDDVALVVISRTGGESFDLPMVASNGAKHYLDLDTNEREMLTAVKNAGFGKVIVVLNTLNIMETSFLSEYGVDACLWIGGPGSTGIMALGDILNGTVNPSGHTTDTWSVDFTKDPTFNNFSERGASNGSRTYNTDTKSYLDVEGYGGNYVNYEESIYMGYRYYETRAEQERAKSGNDSWYEENVAFPFGYGLSYTTFETSLKDGKNIDGRSIEKGTMYEITVEVKNTGTVAGKEVVQVYAKLPYTAGGVEKPYEVLVGYAKTPMLYPESEASADKPNTCELVIEIDPYDFASYDYKGASGFTGYVLEEGEYSLLINSDAHTNIEEVKFSVAEDITYAEDPETNNPVVNRYTDNENEAFDSDTKLEFLMSREDLSVLPDGYKVEDTYVDNAFAAQILDVSHNNTEAASYTEMPKTGEAVTSIFADLISYDTATKRYYCDYEDSDWTAILDSLTTTEMLNLFNQGAFKTIAISAINKPMTMESDGPVGWCNFISPIELNDDWYGNNVYTSQVVMSATWNDELIEAMGASVGEEALWGTKDEAGDTGLTYSGWYSPGVNLHRSPFGGRNFEYFSEDPFLTGKIAAAEIRGCKSKGVYTYVKHFALNEQETDRDGGCVWVTEQAMREIYLKPFEYAVKDGGTTAIMSSFNRIGTRWTGGDYRLLTDILRTEWGFKGTVICDYNQTGSYMNNKQMIYAGGDLNLCSTTSRMWKDYDLNSAADITVLRRAAKNILYTTANSNSINNLNYKYAMAYWKIAVIALHVLFALIIIVWGIVAFRKMGKNSNVKIREVKKNR